MPSAGSASQPAPPARIRLLTARGLLTLLGGMALLTLLGAGLVTVAVREMAQESGPVVRVVIAALGVVLALLGLVGMSWALRSRRDTLVIDGSGIRREDGMHPWQLRWEEVRAVGIRDLTRVVKHNPRYPVRTYRRLRERRDVRLMIAVTDPAVAQRAHFVPVQGAPEPFTHEQRLPDLSEFREGVGLVARLDRELAARASGRYAGVVVERPHQRRAPRD